MYANDIIHNMVKFVDCFIFYNELDMLEFRLQYLYDHITYFILVESRVDFQGDAKPLYYDIHKDRFEKYADKIIHVILDNLNINPVQISRKLSWQKPRIITPLEHSNSLREQLQRRSIDIGLKRVSLSADDMVILSDIDEIPDTNIFVPRKGIYSLEQDMYYYKLTYKLKDVWTLSKIMDYESYLKFKDPQQIRLIDFEHIKKAGWHFSYFGNTDYIRFKMKIFGYQVGNASFLIEDNLIKDAINNKKDLYNRGIEILYIPTHENTYLPPNYTRLVA
jgi:beta-1,4-mannosyl-glycoprotein beta-1,4-N-acetylglucosaminyltransferase